MRRERGNGSVRFRGNLYRVLVLRWLFNRDLLPQPGALRVPVVCAALLWFLFLGVGSRAVGVQTGDVITAANADSVAEQVSPGVMWCLKHGMKLNIIPYKQIVLPKPYTEATEKYSGQVKLSDGGRRIEGHVAGLPFPDIDVNTPDAAWKIMWNYYYRPYYTDDYSYRNFTAETGPITDKGMEIERRYVIAYQGRLYYKGRLYIDPKPEMPNPEKLHYKEITGPILAPLDLKGAGNLNYRFLGLEEHDRTWLYLPTLRRVRRLSSAQRSDSVFGQDSDVDSYWGYAGNIGWSKWTYLGKKTMLGAYHASHSPVQWCPPPGDFAFCDDWEPRETFIVEGVSTLPQYAFSKRVLFIDKETYTVMYSDLYDRGGRLWKVVINQWWSTNRASSNPTVTVYRTSSSSIPVT
jgi:hypothetical protein